MAFKIAYGAGHFLQEPGKRLPAELDPEQTREWTLNDQVARNFAEAAAQYEDVELLRTDDPTGRTETGLKTRCQKANRFAADFALSIHHNAGAALTDAGGIVAYSYYGSPEGARYRDAIYDACIAGGGIRGNRSRPRQEKGFYVLRYTAMPCVLMEYGFMDSLQDYHVILQEEYSRKMAFATMEGIAMAAGLRKKEGSQQQIPLEPEDPGKVLIRQVQTACGVNADGIAGPETMRALPLLSMKTNRTHPAVQAVQRYLLSRGYKETGAPDGIAGPRFAEAVAHYQRDCFADGIVGPDTWQKLLGVR